MGRPYFTTPGVPAERVKALREAGVELVMATGDHPGTAAFVARQLGIERVEAGVLPQRKAELVKEYKARGLVVAMAGDGVNDAPALAAADVGIAIGSGTDVAVETGGIVLIRDDPRDVVAAIRLSKRTLRKIKQNLFWAFAYNVALIPLAAGVFYPAFGILLNPIYAAAAMGLSSVTVVSNSLRLRRFAPETH